MSLLKQVRVASELVGQLTPGVVGVGYVQSLTMLLNLRVFADGHQLQRPEQNLPEVSDDLFGLSDGWL